MIISNHKFELQVIEIDKELLKTVDIIYPAYILFFSILMLLLLIINYFIKLIHLIELKLNWMSIVSINSINYMLIELSNFNKLEIKTSERELI